MPVVLTGIYRDNVAALLMRADGAILIGECAEKPGTWSFPQGGVDDGETRREALVRELHEEVSLRPRDYKILGFRCGYAYTYPEGKLKKGIYCGQIQTYFLCKLHGREPNPRLGSPKSPEFLRLLWVQPTKLDLGSFSFFKRDVTRRVLADFFHISLPQEPEAEATTEMPSAPTP